MRRRHRAGADEPIVVRVSDARAGPVRVFTDEAGEAADRDARMEAWRSLRRIVAEVLILQDAAEELLLELRDGRNLGAVAPPCGRLMARLGELGRSLPLCGDAVIDGHTRALTTIHRPRRADAQLGAGAARGGVALGAADGADRPDRRARPAGAAAGAHPGGDPARERSARRGGDACVVTGEAVASAVRARFQAAYSSGRQTAHGR